MCFHRAGQVDGHATGRRIDGSSGIAACGDSAAEQEVDQCDEWRLLLSVFELLDLVPKFSGSFVRFVIDGGLQIVSQPQEFIVPT